MPNAAGLILLKLLQNSALLLGVKKSVSSLYTLFAGAEKSPQICTEKPNHIAA